MYFEGVTQIISFKHLVKYIAIAPSSYTTTTVPLNYNFIFTHVDMHGSTQYFVCKIPKFHVEIIISMTSDVTPITCLSEPHFLVAWNTHISCNLLCATCGISMCGIVTCGIASPRVEHTSVEWPCMCTIAMHGTYMGTHVQLACIIQLTKTCRIQSTTVKART